MSRRSRFRRTRTWSRPRWRVLERTADALPCPAGVYDPVPDWTDPTAPKPLPSYCSGGQRNGFYGAGMVNAYNVVK